MLRYILGITSLIVITTDPPLHAAIHIGHNKSYSYSYWEVRVTRPLHAAKHIGIVIATDTAIHIGCRKSYSY